MSDEIKNIIWKITTDERVTRTVVFDKELTAEEAEAAYLDDLYDEEEVEEVRLVSVVHVGYAE